MGNKCARGCVIKLQNISGEIMSLVCFLSQLVSSAGFFSCT